MDINFERYKVFFHAATELNYTRAAKSLHLTQPAVSQHIHQLESELGVCLFTRSKGGMRLTEEGLSLFTHVQNAFHLLKGAERYIENMRTLKTGRIRIGASDTITKWILLDAVSNFHSAYPGIDIEIFNGPSPASVEKLKTGSLDIAVVNMDSKMSYDDFNVNILSTFENIFVASPKWKVSLEHITHIHDLANFPIICLEKNSTTRRLFDQFLLKSNLSMSINFTFGSMDLIVDMAKRDMGIGLVARRCAQKSIDEKSLFVLPLKDQLPKLPVGLITPKKWPLNKAVSAFYEFLTKKPSV